MKSLNDQLIDAAFSGRARACVDLIDAGANVSAVDQNGNSALHHAMNFKKFEVARRLIERGADLHAVNHRGTTPLHRALQMELSMMQRYLENCEFDPSFVPTDPVDGYLTPFQEAVGKGFPETIDYLVKHFHESLTLVALDGRNIVELTGERRPEIMRIVHSLWTEGVVKITMDDAAVTDSAPTRKRTEMVPL